MPNISQFFFFMILVIAVHNFIIKNNQITLGNTINSVTSQNNSLIIVLGVPTVGRKIIEYIDNVPCPQPVQANSYATVVIKDVIKYQSSLNNITQYIITGDQMFKYTKVSNGILSFNSQFFESRTTNIMDIGSNSALLTTDNNYTIYLKNGYIYEKILRDFQITSVMEYNKGQAFYLGNEIGQIYVSQYSLPRYGLIQIYLNFQMVYQTQKLVQDLSKNYMNISIVTLNVFSIFTQLWQRGERLIFNDKYLSIASGLLDFNHFDNTFSCWFLSTNTSTLQYFIKDNSGSGIQIALSKNNSQRISIKKTGKNFPVWQPSYIFLSNTTYFLSIILDEKGQARKLFINGSLIEALVNDTGISSSDSGSKSIGYDSVSNSYFQGWMDQIIIYSKALKNIQILNMYQKNLLKITTYQHNFKVTKMKFLSNTAQVITADQKGNINIFTQGSTLSTPNLIASYTVKNQNIFDITEGGMRNTLVLSNKQGYLQQIDKYTGKIIDQKQINSLGRTNQTYLSKFANGKIISAQNGSTILEEWIFTIQGTACHQSCATCSSYYNASACLSCALGYPKKTNQTDTQFLCVLNCGSDYTKINGQCVKKSDALTSTTIITSSILSTPALRFSGKALYPIFVFLQDLWFYRYHLQNYSQFVQYVIDEAKQINQMKLTPSFIPTDKLDDFITQYTNYTSNSYKIYDPIHFKTSSIMNTGFLSNALVMIIWAVIGSLVASLLMYVLAYFLKKCSQKNKIINFLWEKAYTRGTFITFIAAVIQTNLISLSFYHFVQLKTTFYLNFFEKINLIVHFLLLYFVTLYSACFYLLISQFSKRMVAQQILTYTEYKIESFFQATYLFSFKNFINGFIHAFLHQFYNTQIISLTVVNLFQIPIIIYYRKCFEFKFDFLALLLYQILFTLLDINFVIRYFEWDILGQYLDQIEMGIVYSLFGIVFLLFLSQIILPLGMLIKAKCFNNSITDQNGCQNSKQIKKKVLSKKKPAQSQQLNQQSYSSSKKSNFPQSYQESSQVPSSEITSQERSSETTSQQPPKQHFINPFRKQKKSTLKKVDFLSNYDKRNQRPNIFKMQALPIDKYSNNEKNIRQKFDKKINYQTNQVKQLKNKKIKTSTSETKSNQKNCLNNQKKSPYKINKSQQSQNIKIQELQELDKYKNKKIKTQNKVTFFQKLQYIQPKKKIQYSQKVQQIKQKSNLKDKNQTPFISFKIDQNSFKNYNIKKSPEQRMKQIQSKVPQLQIFIFKKDRSSESQA